MPAAGEIHRLKKRRLLAGFLAGDESVKHNGQFNSSLSRLNLIFSWQPNFLATTLYIINICLSVVVVVVVSICLFVTLFIKLTGVIQLLSKCSVFSFSGGKRAPTTGNKSQKSTM